MVGSWGGAGADAKQGIECSMPCPASIEAKHKLVQVMLEAPPVFAVQIQKPHEVAESERSGFVGLNEPKDFLLLSLR